MDITLCVKKQGKFMTVNKSYLTIYINNVKLNIFETAGRRTGRQFCKMHGQRNCTTK